MSTHARGPAPSRPSPALAALLALTLGAAGACSDNAFVKTDDHGGGTEDTVAPDIVVDPPFVDFGEVLPGASASATVHITNAGTDTLAIAGLSVGSATVSLTRVDPMLEPGATVDTVLTWTPIDTALSDTLTVASSDPDAPQVDVPLTGSLPPGDLRVDPAYYDFGTVDVGDSDTVVLTVSNVGVGPITVSDWVYDANDADLRVLDAGALTTLPATLAPGATTEVLVEYAPSADGGDEGGLTLISDDPDEPVLVANQIGHGEDIDPCDGYAQTVQLMLTADDSWQGWIDGTSFTGPNANNWSASDTFEWEMACGDHTLALYATDVAHSVSGVIAVVWVEGVVKFVSGPTDWTIVDAMPPAGWTDVGFDDSGWNIPQVCSSTAPWGAAPQPFYDQGAQWIWWTSTCSDLGQAWLRLNFTVTAP